MFGKAGDFYCGAFVQKQGAWKEGNTTDARPVSYTHLDVYKRQGFERQVQIFGKVSIFTAGYMGTQIFFRNI